MNFWRRKALTNTIDQDEDMNMKEHKYMPLNVMQIEWLDNIQADRTANEHTLKIALQFHSNQASSIEKERDKLWGQLAEQYGIDLDKQTYKITTLNRSVQIVPVEDDEEG